MAGKTCETSIIFTGDIGFDRYMAKKWLDEQLLSREILDFLHSADHVAANVEGTLIDASDDGTRGVFFHSMDPDAACFLRKIRADIWCIGNNHTMDAGEAGIISTKKIAAAEGAVTVGAGLDVDEASAPIFIDEAGGIGMIAVAYQAECIPATEDSAGIFRWDDMGRIALLISEIKSKCRWCVVIAHGGEEFAPLPNPYTRERYIKYLELGADAVVAHHPHVPENYELFEDGKMIFYSLGNFIFDTDYQRAHSYTDLGVLLKLRFSEEKIDFEAIGMKLDRAAGRLYECELPDIFTNIGESDYAALAPLSARGFLAEEMRKMIYLEPERFRNAGEDEWNEYFFSTEPDGYFEGAHMDLSLIVPFAQTLDEKALEDCKLEGVKKYIEAIL
jgi:poly-gamma-glutamate synthesis protein (capsule biosynthesis protein)